MSDRIGDAEKALDRDDWEEADRLLREALKARGDARDSRLLGLRSRLVRGGRRKGLVRAWRLPPLKDAGSDGCVAIDPAGRWAASAWKNRVLLWELPSGGLLGTFPGHPLMANDVAFLPEGGRLLSVGDTLIVRDLPNAASARRYEGQAQIIHSAAVLPDSRQAVLLSGSLPTWPLRSRWVGKGPPPPEDSEPVSWQVQLWDLASFERLSEADFGADAISPPAVSPDGRMALWHEGPKGELVLWDVSAWREARRYAVGAAPIRAAAFAPAGRTVVTAGGASSGELRCWSLASGRLLAEAATTAPLLALQLASDGRMAFAGDAEGRLVLWDLDSEEPPVEVERCQGPVAGLALSRDCRFLLASCVEGPVLAWELDWDYDFPKRAAAPWAARPLIEVFLDSRRGAASDEDFVILFGQTVLAGLIPMDPAALREEFDRMAAEYPAAAAECLARRYGIRIEDALRPAEPQQPKGFVESKAVRLPADKPAQPGRTILDSSLAEEEPDRWLGPPDFPEGKDYLRVTGSAEISPDPRPKFLKALVFESGDLWMRDRRLAHSLYQQAAEAGFAPAQNNLGCRMERSSPEEAMRLYRQAASQGNAAGQYNLARLLLKEASSSPEALGESLRWLNKAASQGHAKAEWRLGILHWEGIGVTADEAESLRWLRQAAGRGLAPAQTMLGTILRERKDNARDQAEGLDWLFRAARQDHGDALFLAAGCLLMDKSSAGDPFKAERFLRRGAGLGDANCLFGLGGLFRMGFLGEADLQEAYVWLTVAAARSNDKDIQEAFASVGKDLDDGPRDAALSRAAELCLMGMEVPRDLDAARSWYETLAAKGSSEAQFRLGLIHETGRVGPQDTAEAEKRYRQAAKQGHAAAAECLERLSAGTRTKPEPVLFGGFVVGEPIGAGAFSVVFAADSWAGEGKPVPACLKLGRLHGNGPWDPARMPLPAPLRSLPEVIAVDAAAGGGVIHGTGSVRFGAVSQEKLAGLFRDEARLLRQAQGSLLPRLLESGEKDGVPFLLMERLAGSTAREALRLPRGEEHAYDWIKLVRGLLRELSNLRAAVPGFYHGDIKPENMVMSHERIRLIDPAGRDLDGFEGPRTVTAAYNPLALAGSEADTTALAIVLFEVSTAEQAFAGYDKPLLHSSCDRPEHGLEREQDEFLALERLKRWRFRPYLSQLLDWMRRPPPYEEMEELLGAFDPIP